MDWRRPLRSSSSSSSSSIITATSTATAILISFLALLTAVNSTSVATPWSSLSVSQHQTSLVSSLTITSATKRSAAPANLPPWLQPLVPKRGETLQDEIRCYNLPYGGIGFLSHFLTYWAVFWLGHGRRPYMPWRPLSAGLFDFLLSLVQIFVTIAIASFTIYRCRSRWQFVLIAVWKLTLSMEVGIWGMRAAYIVMHNKRYVSEFASSKHILVIWSFRDWSAYTMLLYCAGIVVGMVGLLSLVVELISEDRRILVITATFGSATFVVLAVCAVLLTWNVLIRNRVRVRKFALGMVFTVILVCALYSDWILGDIAGNLKGYPSGDNSALYWIYFAAKRLPLLFT